MAAKLPIPFTPAKLRRRHDGWTPEKQTAFIEALAESGCVDESARRVGMSVQSAYALRRRVDAQSFRTAWDCALDYAIRRLSDAAFSRAINGVVRPVFYKGEQVGERRYYDERLTMFLLRYRDPTTYGKWLDHRTAHQHPDGPALMRSRAVHQAESDAMDETLGIPRDPDAAALPLRRITHADDLPEDDDGWGNAWGDWTPPEGDVP